MDDAFEPLSPLRIEYLKSCIKWTVACGEREGGDPHLHGRLGHCLWAEGKTKEAISHFVAGEAPETINQKLSDSHSGNGAEQLLARDRSLVVAVLSFLAVENMRDANELMCLFKRTQRLKGAATESNLITFLDQLLQTCRRDAQTLFKTLVNKNTSRLDFDPAVEAMLMGPIGQRFFKIEPKVNPMMAMMQQLLN